MTPVQENWVKQNTHWIESTEKSIQFTEKSITQCEEEILFLQDKIKSIRLEIGLSQKGIELAKEEMASYIEANS